MKPPANDKYLFAAGSNQCERNSEPQSTRGADLHAVWREFLVMVKTFTKDFELLEVWFNNEMASTELQSSLVNLTMPLFTAHKPFYDKLEKITPQRMNFDRLEPRVNDEFSEIASWLLELLPKYETLYDRLPPIIERLNCRSRFDDQFEKICKEFETRKGCYLPYNFFILKPIFHTFTYHSLVQRLSHSLIEFHAQRSAAAFSDVHQQLRNFLSRNSFVVTVMLNSVILLEIQRDICGFHKLIQPGRTFVRLGCLLKLSNNGYQQRMFFLFSDILMYCSRLSQTQQWKMHGILPLKNVTIEKTAPRMGVKNCFTLYSGNRAIMLAAYSEREMELWLNDIRSSSYNNSENCGIFIANDSFSEEIFEELNHVVAQHTDEISVDHSVHSRAVTLIHVCWHRNCTISLRDYQLAFSSCLSGYLLRKSKNTDKWQKLWVTFTNFCLFFYKSNEDHFPLASLPILGYTVTVPSEPEIQHQKFVFKLQFRTHVYCFRTEDSYSFRRWIDTIEAVTTCEAVRE